MGAQAFFFPNTIQKRNKMVLDIPKEVKDVIKVKEKADVEEDAKAASICQPVNQMTQTGRPVYLTVAI